MVLVAAEVRGAIGGDKVGEVRAEREVAVDELENPFVREGCMALRMSDEQEVHHVETLSLELRRAEPSGSC